MCFEIRAMHSGKKAGGDVLDLFVKLSEKGKNERKIKPQLNCYSKNVRQYILHILSEVQSTNTSTRKHIQQESCFN